MPLILGDGALPGNLEPVSSDLRRVPVSAPRGGSSPLYVGDVCGSAPPRFSAPPVNAVQYFPFSEALAGAPSARPKLNGKP